MDLNYDKVSQIVVIGSINTDMVVSADKLPRPGETVLGEEFLMTAGGKGANQAVAAARLGARVAMVGSLGLDLFGDAARANLLAETIDCHHVNQNSETSSGVALISVDKRGENHIVVAPGANSTLSERDIESALASIPDQCVILIQLEIPMTTVAHAVRLAAAKHCRIILDPAPAQPLGTDLLDHVYLITPNQTEAEVLTGIEVRDAHSALTAAKALLQQGTETVALTLGAEGVLLASQKQHEVIPAPTVQSVDTTAAGDCFNGALAAALAKGWELREAARYACHAAAISVTRKGAQSSMPRADELNQDKINQDEVH